MGKDTGFIEFEKQAVPRREIQERVQDFREYDLNYSDNDIRQQASRCMDCGIPFCHMGCPLGNMIPDWNDLVYRDQWQDALGALHSTNNFPEFTGRICPAPCLSCRDRIRTRRIGGSPATETGGTSGNGF